MCEPGQYTCSGNPELVPVGREMHDETLGQEFSPCMCADGEDSTHLICMNQHHEGISLAACIFLIHQKIMDQLWSVGDEVVKVPNPNK